MKKLFTVIVVILFTTTIQAESPQKISYQAIIRNTKGELVKNQSIGMKISIYFYNKTMPVTSYAETQTPTTNENGLVSILIGTGTVVTGIFADIDWAARAFYLKTEIDPGGRTSYSITSDTQILSVPYALHAKTSTTAQRAESLSINGATYTPEYLVDIDGNAYKTVKIGKQVWMAENLKVTRYRNGEVIPNVKDGSAWSALTTGAWCDYNNLAINGNKYGHLYNWYAVADPRNIAPEGWHVPTEAELTELQVYLIANGGNWDGTTTENKIGKSLAATTNWNSFTTIGCIGNDISSNNSSGFSGLPSGLRHPTGGGFLSIGNSGLWWSSSINANGAGAWLWHLNVSEQFMTKSDNVKIFGLSVRCVRD